MDSAASADRVNADVCLSRFNAIYQSWNKVDFGDALLLLTGKFPPDDPNINAFPGSTHLWLFELIFPETLILFLKNKRVLFSAKGKKMKLFKELNDSKLSEVYSLEFFPREKDVKEHLQEIINALTDTKV